QALAALNEARAALYPLRRNSEAVPLLTRLAPLLAASGDVSGAQDVLSLLPAGDRDSLRRAIVAAQLRNDDISGALQLATAIRPDNVRAQALLLVVQAQAAAANFQAALNTAALIPPDTVESPQALLEIAKQQNQAGKRAEALQLLRRAAAV